MRQTIDRISERLLAIADGTEAVARALWPVMRIFGHVLAWLFFGPILVLMMFMGGWPGKGWRY